MKKIIVLLLLFVFIACEKTPNNGIPGVFVNIALDLGRADFQPLNAVGGAVEITGGVRGIIVYRYSQNEYLAYDRNCTYLPEQSNSRVGLDSSRIRATDSTCGSEFELNSGSPLKGPATAPLQRYTTSLDENGTTLFIRN